MVKAPVGECEGCSLCANIDSCGSGENVGVTRVKGERVTRQAGNLGGNTEFSLRPMCALFLRYGAGLFCYVKGAFCHEKQKNQALQLLRRADRS